MRAERFRRVGGVAAGGLLLIISASLFRRRQRRRTASQPEEIATGVYRLTVGPGFGQSNVYFVQSGTAWVLIDAAWAGDSQQIKQAAESLFGANANPAAIVLTHIHPDHSGSARALARMWNVPVYVHPDEMPLASGQLIPEYFNPLDRWLVAPLMRLMPRRMTRSMLEEASLVDVARAFEPSAGVPGLADWQCIPTPGHTPGHVAFFRERDGVLIAGDAVLMVNLNSLWDFVRNKQRVSGPPYISTWNWQAATESVAALARLEPRVLACGHGLTISGPGAARDLRAFADRFRGEGLASVQQPTTADAQVRR